MNISDGKRVAVNSYGYLRDCDYDNIFTCKCGHNMNRINYGQQPRRGIMYRQFAIIQ